MAIKRSTHLDLLAGDRVGDPTTEQLQKSKQHSQRVLTRFWGEKPDTLFLPSPSREVPNLLFSFSFVSYGLW